MTDQRSSRPPRAGARVLVVDDEPELRSAIAALLRHEGYRVYEAPNGAVGFEVAMAERPDVVVFDWAMPVVGGRAMVEALRETMRPLPSFVAVSAVQQARAWCADNGVPFVVTKPFEDTTLIRAVDSALARAHADRAPRTPSASGTRAIARPAWVVAVGERAGEEAIQESLPESLRHARIVVVDGEADARRILDMIVPDLVVLDDVPEHDALRVAATRKAVPVLVRPSARSESRMPTLEGYDQASASSRDRVSRG